MTDRLTDRELLIELNGKVDAYAAGQSARIDAIDKRLDRHENILGALQAARISQPISGWKVASVIVASIVAMVVIGNGILGLVQSTVGG